MLKDNRNYNAQVTSNTAFLKTLRDKLPEFFTADKIDEDGIVTSQGTFDFEKFKKALEENSIQTELTSGYQLNFIGKDYAKKQAGEAPTTVVLPDKVHNEQTENQNSQNLFFTGDNLEVLRHLQAGYENSIDVIYIDPPYNTGSDGFVYPDKFEYSDAKLQAMFGMSDEELKRLKSIQGKATHSAWLTFMYPRLWLAKRLLKETGVIFVSIDDNEQANLKMLMDEIFGEGNFVSSLVHQRAKGGGQAKYVVKGHDIIHVYSKNITYLSPLVKPKAIQGKIIEKDGIQYLKNDDIYRKQFGKYEKGTERRLYYEDALEIKGEKIKAEIDQKLKNGEIFKEKRENGKHILYSLTPVAEATSKVYSIIKVLSEEGKGRLEELQLDSVFSYPKPAELVKQIIQSNGDKNSTILDFFAGSATTADAVMQLNAEDGGNRQFIMVQLPEPTFTQNSDGTKVARKGSESAFKAGYQSIDEISRERIKRASQKIQEEKGLELPEGFDGGFKHYRILEPSQVTVDDLDSFDIETGDFIDNKGNHLLLSESGFDDMISPFSSQGLGFDNGATGEETILSTWLLADGYSILTPVKELDLAGYQANYVNSERLYLIAEDWSSEQTKELVNIIGKNEKVVQTIVLYGYSFGMESMRELESALEQLDTKVNLIKRY